MISVIPLRECLFSQYENKWNHFIAEKYLSTESGETYLQTIQSMPMYCTPSTQQYMSSINFCFRHKYYYGIISLKNIVDHETLPFAFVKSALLQTKLHTMLEESVTHLLYPSTCVQHEKIQEETARRQMRRALSSNQITQTFPIKWFL